MIRPLLLLALFALPAYAGTALSDSFTSTEAPKERRASRGPWVIADGIAKVTQDDELYKQHKDHGPIIFYDIEFKDAVIEFAFKPEAAKTFVFTVNGAEGHVFRTVTSDRGTNLRAFPPDGEAKSIALLNLAEAPLKQGEWTPMKIELRGDKAVVSIGGQPPVTVEHASLNRAKTNTSLGFSFGTLSVKDFSLRALE
jgi:hypothetical protein